MGSGNEANWHAILNINCVVLLLAQYYRLSFDNSILLTHTDSIWTACVSFLGSKPVVIYEMFKTLATRLSIALFLSHDLGEEEASEISELMTTHWRGIISIPLSMRVPWYGWKSGYSKALAAKVGSSVCV